MTTLVLRPFVNRLFSCSPCSPTSSRPSSPSRWLYLSSTKSSISRRFLGTFIHSISSGNGVRFQARGGLPWCPFGVESPSLHCRQIESSSNGSRNQTVLAEHGEEPSTKEEWERLKKWTRGGAVVHKLARSFAWHVFHLVQLINH